MPLKPLRDLLYVLPFEQSIAEKSGLIHIPESVQRRANQGIVKYRGPETTGQIQVGDHVLFGAYAGDELVIEGEGQIVVLRERDVDAVFIEPENDDGYLITLSKVKYGLAQAAAQIAHKLGESEQRMVYEVANRLRDQLDARFFEELYY